MDAVNGKCTKIGDEYIISGSDSMSGLLEHGDHRRRVMNIEECNSCLSVSDIERCYNLVLRGSAIH